MPVFITHNEGGSWLGGGTEVEECNEDQQQALLDAFDSLIDKPCLNCFPGLRDRLLEVWDTVKISCNEAERCDSEEDPISGHWNGDRVLICPEKFEPVPAGLPFTSADQLESILLHELVHACGSDKAELDARAVENHCYGFGATLGELQEARGLLPAFGDSGDEFEGFFVIWNAATGEIWGKVLEGGGWLGGGQPTKGDLCFQSRGFVVTPDEGGGWF